MSKASKHLKRNATALNHFPASRTVQTRESNGATARVSDLAGFSNGERVLMRWPRKKGGQAKVKQKFTHTLTLYILSPPAAVFFLRTGLPVPVMVPVAMGMAMFLVIGVCR